MFPEAIGKRFKIIAKVRTVTLSNNDLKISNHDTILTNSDFTQKNTKRGYLAIKSDNFGNFQLNISRNSAAFKSRATIGMYFKIIPHSF